MILECVYCNLDTAGNHEKTCPIIINSDKNKDEKTIGYNTVLFGWVCPRCFLAHSPLIDTCSCGVTIKQKGEI